MHNKMPQEDSTATYNSRAVLLSFACGGVLSLVVGLYLPCRGAGFDAIIPLHIRGKVTSLHACHLTKRYRQPCWDYGRPGARLDRGVPKNR